MFLGSGLYGSYLSIICYEWNRVIYSLSQQLLILTGWTRFLLSTGLTTKSINQLQPSQNAAGRVLTGTIKRAHVTPSFCTGFQLVSSINVKILVIVSKCVLCVYSYVPCGSIRSTDSLLLTVKQKLKQTLTDELLSLVLRTAT